MPKKTHVTKKTYKYYRVTFTPAYPNEGWMRDLPFTTTAIGEADGKELFAKYPDDTCMIQNKPYSVTKSINEEHLPYMSVNICSQWAPDIFKGINAGESRTCRGEYSGTFKTCKEYYEDAMVMIKEIQKEQASRENAYYSQLWV